MHEEIPTDIVTADKAHDRKWWIINLMAAIRARDSKVAYSIVSFVFAFSVSFSQIRQHPASAVACWLGPTCGLGSCYRLSRPGKSSRSRAAAPHVR